jgi:hypothetical protein
MTMLQPVLIEPQPKQPYTGPDYTNFVFTLQSSTNKNWYRLIIDSMNPNDALYSAYITGTWGPYDPNDPTAPTNTNPFTGLITDNGEGIQCTWFDTPTAKQQTVYQHQLTGGLTYYPRHLVNHGRFSGVAPATAFLQDGVVVVFDPNAPAGTPMPGMGPGNVSGSGVQAI